MEFDLFNEILVAKDLCKYSLVHSGVEVLLPIRGNRLWSLNRNLQLTII